MRDTGIPNGEPNHNSLKSFDVCSNHKQIKHDSYFKLCNIVSIWSSLFHGLLLNRKGHPFNLLYLFVTICCAKRVANNKSLKSQNICFKCIFGNVFYFVLFFTEISIKWFTKLLFLR